MLVKKQDFRNLLLFFSLSGYLQFVFLLQEFLHYHASALCSIFSETWASNKSRLLGSFSSTIPTFPLIFKFLGP